MDACFVYMTAPDRDTALEIGRQLVNARLLACANVIPGATSIYRWDGAVHEDAEVVMIGKTRAALAQSVVARIVALHPYECPCVTVIPIKAGHPAFLDWIEAETAGA